MYLNYYTREMMNQGDNSTIGSVLCVDKSDQVVKYTLQEYNNQVFSSSINYIYQPKKNLRKN